MVLLALDSSALYSANDVQVLLGLELSPMSSGIVGLQLLFSNLRNNLRFYRKTKFYLAQLKPFELKNNKSYQLVEVWQIRVWPITTFLFVLQKKS